MRSPVQRAVDEQLQRLVDSGLNTLIEHAEKMGRHWTQYVRHEDSHGRTVWVAIVQVTMKYEKRR